MFVKQVRDKQQQNMMAALGSDIKNDEQFHEVARESTFALRVVKYTERKCANYIRMEAIPK